MLLNIESLFLRVGLLEWITSLCHLKVEVIAYYNSDTGIAGTVSNSKANSLAEMKLFAFKPSIEFKPKKQKSQQRLWAHFSSSAYLHTINWFSFISWILSYLNCIWILWALVVEKSLLITFVIAAMWLIVPCPKLFPPMIKISLDNIKSLKYCYKYWAPRYRCPVPIYIHINLPSPCVQRHYSAMDEPWAKVATQELLCESSSG